MSIPASAQSQSAYQAGIGVATQRGVSNRDCYASVFAKHARVVENANGGRFWSAQSTPAYNAELRRRCGVDRLELVRTTPTRSVRGAQASRGELYGAGLGIARSRGYPNPDCYARIFSQHAGLTNDINGRRRVGTPTSQAFVGELWNQCRISR
jgi:hypothetical protein